MEYSCELKEKKSDTKTTSVFSMQNKRSNKNTEKDDKKNHDATSMIKHREKRRSCLRFHV